MSLLGSMIVTVCMGSGSANYRSACNASLDAASQQSGVNHNVEEMERNTGRWADQKATDTLGENGKQVTGGMIFLIKTAADRAIMIPIPTAGLADKISSKISSDEAMIMFRWNF